MSTALKTQSGFSNEAHRMLYRSPFMIFFLVAGADGDVDDKEMRAFGKAMGSREFQKVPLLYKVIENTISDFRSAAVKIEKQKPDFLEELRELKEVLDNHLSVSEAAEIKIALLRMGKLIAQASGSFLSFGNNISKEEAAALADIASCFELDEEVP